MNHQTADVTRTPPATTDRRGWSVITLSSAELELEIVPGLGGTITGLCRRADGLQLLHQTPWGLPGAGGLAGSPVELRHDLNPGGWQTLFPNAGDNAVVGGVEWGTDGEARVAPFDQTVEIDRSSAERDGDQPADGQQADDQAANDPAAGERLVLSTRLRRSPFRLTKIISLTGSTVRLRETIEHCGGRPTEVMWSSRVAFAPPLIGADTEIDSGASIVHPDSELLYDVDYTDVSPWPRTPGPDSMINLRYLPEPGSGTNRMAYLTDFDRAWVSVSSPTLDCRVQLDWDKDIWPHAWYELEDGGTHDHPWWGVGRFLALTPSSSWPARGLHDARRVSRSVISLSPGEVRTADLTVRVERLG